ncbi:MAG: hypothetical protein WC044_14525 [Crocinitomicaceae bacterium]
MGSKNESELFLKAEKELREGFAKSVEPIHDFLDRYAGTGVIVGINLTCIGGCWRINSPTIEGESLRNFALKNG